MTRHHVRWMVRKDLAEVMDIDERSFLESWGYDGFISRLRDRKTIGMVAEARCGDILGYMAYQLWWNRIKVLRLAVAADRRREGVGSTMIARLKGKLSPIRRSRLVVALPEDEATIVACRFLAAQGFTASLDRSDDPHVYRFEHACQAAGVLS